MAEKLLTDRALRAAAPREKEYLLADGGSLYARVRATREGAATLTWQFFFKWQGKTERLSIGPYPAVSLAAARARRDAAREILKSDPPRHPVHEARARVAEAHAKAMTESTQRSVRALFEDWRSVYLAHHRKDKGAQVLEFFEHDVFPAIGALRARAVTRTHIVQVIDRLLARGARRKANAVLAMLKQMLAHAVVRGLVDQDPTYGFSKRHAGGKDKSRERVLSEAELEDLARKLPGSGLAIPYQAAVRFLLATGARVGELNKARWDQLDLGARTWTIPKENAKNGREHVVHLCPFALDQLETLAAHRFGDWLLSSRTGDAPIEDKALVKALRDRQREKPLKGRTKACATLRLDGGDWSPHDLRRTLSTRMGDLAVPPHVIERCLNHTMQGVMAVYNRADYAAERKDALERWGAQLERLFAPAPAAARVPANVIALPRAPFASARAAPSAA